MGEIGGGGRLFACSSARSFLSFSSSFSVSLLFRLVSLHLSVFCFPLLRCSQTFWEQIDDGEQLTPARKFLLVMPVALFILATHTSDFRRQPLLINAIVVIVLVLAKLSIFHRVRIFGINKD